MNESQSTLSLTPAIKTLNTLRNYPSFLPNITPRRQVSIPEDFRSKCVSDIQVRTFKNREDLYRPKIGKKDSPSVKLMSQFGSIIRKMNSSAEEDLLK